MIYDDICYICLNFGIKRSYDLLHMQNIRKFSLKIKPNTQLNVGKCSGFETFNRCLANPVHFVNPPGYQWTEAVGYFKLFTLFGHCIWTFVRSVGITRATVIIICYKWISIILMRAERSAIVQMEMNNSEQSRLNRKKNAPYKWRNENGKWEREKRDQNDFYVSETRNSIWYQSNLIFNFNCNATFLKKCLQMDSFNVI